MKVIIINKTPHPINLLDGDNKVLRTWESEGQVRLSMKTQLIGTIDGVPITRTKFGKPSGLPEQQIGTFYIVSQMIKSALGRDDLLVPDEVQRDSSGRILGCRSLRRWEI